MKKAEEKKKVLTRCSICDGAAKVWREGEAAALRDVRTIDERARWSVCCEDCLQSLVSVVVRGHHSATVHDMEDGSAFIQLIDLPEKWRWQVCDKAGNVLDERQEVAAGTVVYNRPHRIRTGATITLKPKQES